MHIKQYSIILPALLLASFAALHASELKLAPVFTDHAVLQRDKPVPVWGQASPGENVTVTFASASRSVKADTQGCWKVILDPMPASLESREMLVRGSEGEQLAFKDILVGEVWLASGQSNMSMSVIGCANLNEEKAAANFPLIRQFKVSNAGSLKPENILKGNWAVCSSTTVAYFTGVGYFFAREIHQKLGVPIGIIHSSWGGTPAEAWTSREALDTVPELKTVTREEIAQMERALEEWPTFLPSLSAWESANGVDDKENEGVKNGWAAPDFDDSGWKTVTTGFNLCGTLKAKNGGVFWMRKSVELPAESAGKPFNLILGYLAKQFDTIYFNGVELGRTGSKPPLFYTCARNYPVPGKLVKTGKNVIAARFVAHTPKGGLYVAGCKLGLPVADPHSVSNDWKFCFERQFPELSPEALAARPKLNRSQIQLTSAALFNGMIHPLIPYSIRGVIWYQGENNANPRQAEQYKTLFPLMISDWRKRWGLGDFPFYFVQLANNDPAVRTHAESDWAVLRDTQTQTLKTTPNTGMAVTIDIGSDITIHPLNKQDVGKRLALWARAKTYGEKGLVFQSPLYQSHTVEGGKIRVRFDTGGAPLMAGKKEGLNPVTPTPGARLEWFEISGADGKWAWADAVIEGDSVVVSSPDVPVPTAVRYAWATNPEGCNLYNKEGLPASPFNSTRAGAIKL